MNCASACVHTIALANTSKCTCACKKRKRKRIRGEQGVKQKERASGTHLHTYTHTHTHSYADGCMKPGPQRNSLQGSSSHLVDFLLETAAVVVWGMKAVRRRLYTWHGAVVRELGAVKNERPGAEGQKEMIC